ncbi:hypothetical protein SDRG_16322 [Saprolegnia diclina VS20]|uniref:Uncharacterized protein n=1 Tax=Saprolegnia diclina (strain VS20) TaxID=1156394 RepID=T0PU82_SAPDV|nr:hypothetical protein SDRG_16322 [Saprolegnia diclina VS20]EQC25806.1 hypothetical protein SDRG_16322 [Saprolegnia diclina VS20]|eukprot:XP_008620748.1 hypothetical protein SDRG_16322 [Saprolegnia diclina VS20]
MWQLQRWATCFLALGLCMAVLGGTGRSSKTCACALQCQCLGARKRMVDGFLTPLVKRKSPSVPVNVVQELYDVRHWDAATCAPTRNDVGDFFGLLWKTPTEMPTSRWLTKPRLYWRSRRRSRSAMPFAGWTR